MPRLQFSAKMRIIGVNPYILVTQEQAQQLKPGWRKPMPVTVRVNGQPAEPWHINMMPAGNGDYYLYLAGEVRKASGTAVGDTVDITVDFDGSYAAGPQNIPDWFTAALAANPTASTNWHKLPPSRQKEVARYLARLKSPAAQANNLEQILTILSGNDGHYMGRDWQGGKGDFVLYIDFDATLYNTALFVPDLVGLIAKHTGLSPETIRADSKDHFFHPSLGGYEYHEHIDRYGLNHELMWRELHTLAASKDYLYEDSAAFFQALRASGYNPKILTFGEEKFQLAKVTPTLPLLAGGGNVPEVIVVSQPKKLHIAALHAGQRGALVDDKPDQQLPAGFTEIHIDRASNLAEPVVNRSVVRVSSLEQARLVITSL